MEKKTIWTTLESSKICGGGAKSPLWKEIFANVLNVKLEILESEQGPGMGGAMLAMVADGTYGSVKEVCDALVRVVDRVCPTPELSELYEQRYQQFKQIYPALKPVFPQHL